MLVPLKADKGISNDLKHVLVVLRLGAGSPGPSWLLMDNLVFHEKSRYNILLWDDLTVGKLGDSCMKGGQRNI